jgi:hypothetical protein
MAARPSAPVTVNPIISSGSGNVGGGAPPPTPAPPPPTPPSGPGNVVGAIPGASISFPFPSERTPGPRMPGITMFTGNAQQIGTMNCEGYLNYSGNGGRLTQYNIGNARIIDATNMCLALYYNELKTPEGGIRVSSPTIYTLFGDTGFPEITDITQGGIGSCVYESILASMVYKNKSLVKNSIQHVPGVVGQFYVRLYYRDSSPIYVKITDQLPQRSALNMGIYRNYSIARNGKSIIWPDLFTKAYASIVNVFGDFLMSTSNPVRAGYNYLDGVANDDVKNSLVSLTGRQMTSYKNDASWINNINNPNCIAIAMLNQSTPQTGTLTTRSRGGTTLTPSQIETITYRRATHNKINFLYIYKGTSLVHVIVFNHAYSVFGIFQSRPTDPPKVLFRNPWGTNTLDDKMGKSIIYSNGIMDLTSDFFTTLFSVHYVI